MKENLGKLSSLLKVDKYALVTKTVNRKLTITCSFA